MSASRDQSQKVAFVYSNLYQLYKKGKAAAQEAQVPAEAPIEEPAVAAPLVVNKGLAPSSQILKAEDLNSVEKSSPKVSAYNPTEFIGKRVARPASIPVQASAPKEAITSLKDNLKSLNDLHSRLRFMLQELEDLVKE